MSFQVTSLRTVLGTRERIVTQFPTQAAAEAYAETVHADSVTVTSETQLDHNGHHAVVSHYSLGKKTA
jgi:hypothetical protein